MMHPIHNHPSIVYANDLQRICQPLKKLDIEYFSHVMIDEKKKFSAAGMNPDFVELYFSKKFYNIDIHQSIYHDQRYIIWDTVERDSKLDEVYSDFKSFSLGHSFTIIYSHPKGCKHYYDFSARLGNDKINQSYLKNISFLKKFILYFTEKINSHKGLKAAHDIKFTMSEEYQEEIKHEPILSLPLSRIYFSQDTYLTMREVECLNWLSQGKTIEEIAIILSISTRTMKAHIVNMKKKLDCKNLFQLGLAYQDWMERNKEIRTSI